MAEYYMFHKPRGCISACRDPRHKTVMDYFPDDMRESLFHIGRLDKDTEGLLIISDDGALCNRLMMPERTVKKTYFFWMLGILNEENKRIIEQGINIFADKDFTTAPASISIIENARLSDIKSLLSYEDSKMLRRQADLPITSGTITITEGKKHQVKRMLGYAGGRVLYLKRLSIGSLSLDENLKPGEYRHLTEEELVLLEN